MSEIDGFVLIDKPTGPTSHDVVAAVRRAVGFRRVGHTGTLDPFASGLLPIALGRATRLIRFLDDEPKAYEGTLVLGASSDSDDATGELSPAGPIPDSEAVLAAAARLTGELDQRPPRVSARKVGGQRLYKLARAGREAEAPTKRVRVDTFELEPADPPERWRFRAVVSAGTYIRALARDLGDALGSGGYVETLRRTRCGQLDLGSATPWSGDGRLTIPADRILPLGSTPLALPDARLENIEHRARFLHGNSVADGRLDDGTLRVLDAEGALLGVGEAQEGRLRPVVVVASPPAPSTSAGSPGDSPPATVASEGLPSGDRTEDPERSAP